MSHRALFDLPPDRTYLNCAYLAPQLRSVTAAGIEAVGLKAHPWKVGVDDFFAHSERLRGLFARIVGGDADGVALIPSVSYGVGIAAANVPVERGQRIVLLDEQFPSNVYPWRERARDVGATVEHVARGANGWTARILDAIDDDVAVVAIPNCHWTDGSLVDLVAVGAACRDAGAALVVDGTQSVGAHPFDVAAVQPDFVIAAGYKWLLGPYSLGYLWCAPQWRDGRPLEHNWLNRDASEDFAGLVRYRDAYQAGARRYDVGERSNFALVPMALAALEQLLEWGVERIAAHCAGVTAEIAAQAEARGWRALPADQRVAHMTGVRVPGGLPAGLVGALAERKVHVSVRGDSIRVAPHLYNDLDDVASLFTALDALV